jgi:very-short-patch-repair endonuclease
MADLVKELWDDLRAAASEALTSELSLHGPGDPFDYATWAQFGSPIEVAMFTALTISAHGHYITTELHRPGKTMESATASPSGDLGDFYAVGYCFGASSRDERRRIYPQCNLGRYRVDFIIEQGWGNEWVRVVVECDGHDFHEKTKEQARRDKARDRYMQTFGLSVLRFTGSEIHGDPHGSAEQVHEFILARQHDRLNALEAEFEARERSKK